MDSKHFSLTEDQVDMLAEVFNMGMGHALSALAKLSGQEYEITFSIPEVKIISKEEFLLQEKIKTRNSMIAQNYSGVIKGSAVLYFPESAGKELAKLFIGTDIPADHLDKVESDALIEIGNIFINSSLSCLANFLGEEIETELPKLISPDMIQNQSEECVAIIHLNAPFSIEHLKLHGEVAFILNNESIQRFQKAFDLLIGGQ